MKKIRKTTYVRFARKILLLALPAMLFTLGSCSNEDEVIDLTSDDLSIEILTPPNTDEALAKAYVYEDIDPVESVLADGQEAIAGQITGYGVTRVVLSDNTNFGGWKTRLYASPAPNNSNSLYWSPRTWYKKSMVIAPYTNVKLTNNSGYSKWFYNRYNDTAKYETDLGSNFTGSGKYITAVETKTYDEWNTEQLCGYAYMGTNLSGKSLPVFRSTAISQSTAESYGFNWFRSFESISDSQCEAVSFVSTDESAADNSKVTVDDRSDYNNFTYYPDAFYPEVSFDELLGSYDSDSVDDMMDGFALAVSDGSTTVSQDETDSCNSGYTICKTTVTSLQFVATVATKLTCGGFLAIWSLGTSVLNLIMTGQWWQLGIIAGDAMVTAVKITSGLATPIGEFDALICAVGVITKTLTSALDVGLCNTLKNKCTTTAATTNQD